MRFFMSICSLAFGAICVFAQNSDVDFGMMTWPEVKAAMAAGKTTILVYNGGTEQRGPQCVNAGHTLIAYESAVAIARKLGNALVAPVLPFSPNRASAALPGTIGLTTELFAAINEQVAEQLIITGFKNVVLMGDHGGGQQQLGEIARKLSEKYADKGVKVVWASDVYAKAHDDFDSWLEAHGYPYSTHAGIPDTSEMLYLGGDKGWVRKDLIATAVGDPAVRGRGGDGGGNGRGGRGRGRGPADPHAPPRINNGIQGDARRSTAELGKMVFDMKVDYGVRQIHELLGETAAAK